jgi:hypothetical protein
MQIPQAIGQVPQAAHVILFVVGVFEFFPGAKHPHHGHAGIPVLEHPGDGQLDDPRFFLVVQARDDLVGQHRREQGIIGMIGALGHVGHDVERDSDPDRIGLPVADRQGLLIDAVSLPVLPAGQLGPPDRMIQLDGVTQVVFLRIDGDSLEIVPDVRLGPFVERQGRAVVGRQRQRRRHRRPAALRHCATMASRPREET